MHTGFTVGWKRLIVKFKCYSIHSSSACWNHTSDPTGFFMPSSHSGLQQRRRIRCGFPASVSGGSAPEI